MKARPPFVVAFTFSVSALILSLGLGCDAESEPVEQERAELESDQCPDLETELSILAAHERQAEIWACRVECSQDMIACIDAGGCIDCAAARWDCMESCIAPAPGFGALPYYCVDAPGPDPLCYCNADGVLCDHDGFASCDECPA